MSIAPDLADSVAHGDAAYDAFLDLVDAHVEAQRLGLPPEPAARIREPDPACLREPIRTLDLRAEGVAAIIWATGYAFDFGWIDAPVLDPRGAPVHWHGVTAVPGLFFLGLPWLSRMSSSFLCGVAEDAAQLASHIAERRRNISTAITMTAPAALMAANR